MPRDGTRDLDLDHVLYEPLPALDRDELRRLRAIIGPRDDNAADVGSPLLAGVIDLRDGHAPRSHFEEAIEEVDRKLGKLLDGRPVTVINDGFSQALIAVRGEIDEVRAQLTQLQSSVERLTQLLIG